METQEMIKRIHNVVIKTVSARNVLNDGKIILCDKKMQGIQQCLVDLIKDISVNVSVDGVIPPEHTHPFCEKEPDDLDEAP